MRCSYYVWNRNLAQVISKNYTYKTSVRLSLIMIYFVRKCGAPLPSAISNSTGRSTLKHADITVSTVDWFQLGCDSKIQRQPHLYTGRMDSEDSISHDSLELYLFPVEIKQHALNSSIMLHSNIKLLVSTSEDHNNSVRSLFGNVIGLYEVSTSGNFLPLQHH